MIAKKNEVIEQTLDILRNKLNQSVREEGFEIDMIDDILNIISEWVNHIKNAVK